VTVHGNGGTLTTHVKDHLLNYGDIWFNTDAIINILSLKNVRNKFMLLATPVTAITVLLLHTSQTESTHTLTCMSMDFTITTTLAIVK
jgi:hypothetical protein